MSLREEAEQPGPQGNRVERQTAGGAPVGRVR
jgi:hypothetical protein